MTKRFVNRWMALTVLVLLVTGFSVESPAGSGREYRIKAAFLLNFAKFVDWPPDAFKSRKMPVQLGILGNDPFGESIDSLVQKKVRGRPIHIIRLKSRNDAKDCHILFICNSEREALGDIFQSLKGRSVLTVGETERFSYQGGVIGFVTIKNKIRFEINISAAEQANVKISSKLLKLARIVKGENN